MFSKRSRYHRLPDVVTADAQGRRLASRSLRLLPEVSGDFQHTLSDSDRLDHLAHRYYRHPPKWWRVCDANPEFPSPLALLGAEPLVTTRFALTYTGPKAPWWRLVRELPLRLGVEEVWLGTDRDAPSREIVRPDSQDRVLQTRDVHEPESEVVRLPDSWRKDLEARKRRKVDLPPEAMLRSHGDVWLLLDRGDPDEDDGEARYEERYVVTPTEEWGRYDLFPIILRHRWTVVIAYNEMNVDAFELQQIMESFGFVVEGLGNIGRTGKEIVIPLDTLR